VRGAELIVLKLVVVLVLDFWRRSTSQPGRLSQEGAVAVFRLMRFSKETHLQSTVRANSIEDDDEYEYD
jgi:hypothetical protein